MNQENRTRTGIQGLDRNLEGGFPRGSMIVVAGNPGTGKTMLCGAFLHHGALQGENGLYVSFSEGRETFISNMRRFGLDFESTRSNRVEILDFITSKEPGVDAIMEMITERIEVNRAERLVIDSFTAMAHAFPSLIDERVVLHILSKIVRTTGCTTILVTEVVQYMLLFSSRNKVPVLGLSERQTQMGALLSLSYGSSRDMGRQAGEMANSILS